MKIEFPLDMASSSNIQPPTLSIHAHTTCTYHDIYIYIFMRVRDHDEKSRKYVHGNSIINLKILCNFTVELCAKTLEPIFFSVIFPLGNIFFVLLKRHSSYRTIKSWVYFLFLDEIYSSPSYTTRNL